MEQRLEQYGPSARRRLLPHFHSAGVSYPPHELVLVAVKDARQLEVWARSAADHSFQLIATYPIVAASGALGPKLRQGDRQVPEGLYSIESLHPNSFYHLALRVNYPNDFDRRMAIDDGRTNLGGDIMIHGSNSSVGCLAMGDEVAEELFALVGDTGIAGSSLILTPVDFRVRGLPADMPVQPAWTQTLYRNIREQLSQLQPTTPTSTTSGADQPGIFHRKDRKERKGN